MNNIEGLPANTQLAKMDDTAQWMDVVWHIARGSVACFHDQDMSPEQQADIATRFGQVFRHPTFAQDKHGITLLSRQPSDERVVGDVWHSDTSATAKPPAVSILYGQTIPSEGGSTEFISQIAAASAMPDDMFNMAAGATGLHSDKYVAEMRGKRQLVETHRRTRTAIHPLIIQQPTSLLPALYVNPLQLIRTNEEPHRPFKLFLRYVTKHATERAPITRYDWKPGMCLIWDNRSVLHRAVHNASGTRHVRRIQTQGCVLQAARKRNVNTRK